ncbi:MAG: SBBP repeat-containing protein [Actinomycetota bacterium]|nr:SBBP repeat-containing protein [Actinomycetota bacterium]
MSQRRCLRLFSVVAVIAAGATAMPGLAARAAAGPAAPEPDAATAATRGASAFGRSPLAFEPNVGQAPAGADFVARGGGYSLALSPDGATLASAGSANGPARVVRMRLVGADPAAEGSAQDPSAGRVNYLMGNDPAKWHTDVATFGAVEYRGVYPGVDARYYGTQGKLEYDLTVAPRANPGVIRLGFDGTNGVHLSPSGTLVVSTPAGELTQAAPQLYQNVAGSRRAVSGRFVLQGANRVDLAVGAYDTARPLVIDPTIAYSTYLGGNTGSNFSDGVQGLNSGTGIAIDAAGNAYVAGSSQSTDFPVTARAFQTSMDRLTAAYVAKFSPTGSLVYATFLGGTNEQTFGSGIAVDASGDAVAAGLTIATDFPVTASAFQPRQVGLHGGGFVTKLNATGSALLYSTYVGQFAQFGGDLGAAVGVAVDGSGNAYFTTDTPSTLWPTTPGAFQSSPKGGNDIVVTKLNPMASGAASLVYSTYVGGSNDEQGQRIAVDASGNAIVEGFTGSTDFPVTPGAFQATNHGGLDLFVFKLNAAGTGLVYATYLGGSGNDFATNDPGGVAVDGAGDAYVTAGTMSTDFPTTAGAYQTTNKGTANAVVAKFDPTGALVYSTYLGGTGTDFGRAIAVGPNGTAFVVGDATSTDFPTANPTQAAPGGNGDAFVAQLSAGGTALPFSTYLGGTNAESAFSVAVNSTIVDVTGITTSTDFPTVNPFQPAFGGSNQDAFVTSYISKDRLSIAKTASPTLVAGGGPITYTLAVQNPGTVGPATGVTVTDPLPAGVTFVSANATQGTCAQSAGTVTCSLGRMAANTTATVTVAVTAPTISTKLTNTATVAAHETDPHPGNNTATAVVYVNAADLALTKTATPKVVAFGQPLTYSVTATNNGPTDATGVNVVDPLPTGAVLQSAVSSQGTCTQSAGTVTCKLGGLASAAQATVAITVMPKPGLITNSATVSGDQVDPTPANNGATASVFANGNGCGQVITKTTVLTADIGPCRGDGVIIGTDNITLNLAGHRIFGFGASNDGTHPGIRLPGRTGVTIVGGVVSGFDAGILINRGANNRVISMNIHDNIGPDIAGFGSQLGDGIAILRSARNRITANTINHNGWYDGIGIFGVGADGNLVQSNTITNTVGSVVDRQDGEGIDLNSVLTAADRGQSLSGNNFIANTITDNQASGLVSSSNLNATIKGNDIERNGLDYNTRPNDGIAIQFSGPPATVNTNDLVQANTVLGNGANGIAINGMEGNHIIGNRTGGNDATFHKIANSPFSYDLIDLGDPGGGCGTNVWQGNIWGSGGYNPPCTTAGGSGPNPPPAPKAVAAAAAAPRQSGESKGRPDIPL